SDLHRQVGQFYIGSDSHFLKRQFALQHLQSLLQQ
ncbi:hypothetical protein ACZ87_01233, partial [Candidatus Erwinia dacicola]